MRIARLFDVLLGLGRGWEEQFDRDSKTEVEKLQQEQVIKGMLTSGIGRKKIEELRQKRKQEKQDEKRKRLLEGLKLLPPWLALLISLISLVISLNSNKKANTAFLPPEPARTEVIEYQQTFLPEEKRTGNCWTSSLAVSSSPKAWRCAVEEGGIVSFIFDPCFETDEGNVVCGIDPQNPTSGFELELTRPLPENRNESLQERISFWQLELENGDTCRPHTGTIPSFHGEWAYYLCDNGYTLGDFQENNGIYTIGYITGDDYGHWVTKDDYESVKSEIIKSVMVQKAWR
jgi:hypothetical protein